MPAILPSTLIKIQHLIFVTLPEIATFFKDFSNYSFLLGRHWQMFRRTRIQISFFLKT